MNKKKLKICRTLPFCAVLCAMTMCAGGCTTHINGDFCDLYEPVFPDYARDTPETIMQIDRNNIVYDACGGR